MKKPPTPPPSDFEITNKDRITDNSDKSQSRIKDNSEQNQNKYGGNSLYNRFKNGAKSESNYDKSRTIQSKIERLLSKVQQIESYGAAKKFIDEQNVSPKEYFNFWVKFYKDFETEIKKKRQKVNRLKKNQNAHETIEMPSDDFLITYKKLVRLLKTDFIKKHYKSAVLLINGKQKKYNYKTMPHNWIDQSKRNIPNSLKNMINKRLSQSYTNDTINKVLKTMYEAMPAFIKWFYDLTLFQQIFLKYIVPCSIVVIGFSAGINHFLKSQTARQMSQVIEKKVDTIIEEAKLPPYPEKKIEHPIETAFEIHLNSLIDRYNNATAPPIYDARRKRIIYWITNELELSDSTDENILFAKIQEGHFKQFTNLYIK